MDSIDKFGRHLTKFKIDKSLTRYPNLQTSVDGHYNFQNKRLSNIQSPVEAADCANKGYVDNKFTEFDKIIKHTKLPQFKHVSDLAKLQIDVDSLKQSIASNTHSITDLTSTINQLRTLTEVHTNKINKVGPLDVKLRTDLEVAIEQMSRSEATFKRSLNQLEKKIDNKIKKLETKK